MKPKLAFVWFVVSFALLALLIVQAREKKQQQQKLETLQLQVEKLDAAAKTAQSKVENTDKELRMLGVQLHAAELEASSARAQLAMRRTNLAHANSSIGSESRGEPSREAGEANFGAMFAKMMNDPEMRKAMEQQQKLAVGMLYNSLVKRLQLTPDQEKRFYELLLEQQMANISQASTLFSAEDRSRAIEEMAEERKQWDEEFKGVLGDEKYAQFQQYNQTIGERMMLEQFGKGIDLQPEQTEHLLGIIAEERNNIRINQGTEMMDPTRDWERVMQSPEVAEQMLLQQEQVNARVIERATEALSPEQAQQLAPILANQLEMQRAGMKMARQMFGGGAENPASQPNPAP